MTQFLTTRPLTPSCSKYLATSSTSGNRPWHGPHKAKVKLIGWKAIHGAVGLDSYLVSGDRPISNANRHFLRLTAKTAGPDAGCVNEGFRGMGLKQGAEYTFSVCLRRGAGSIVAQRVTLEELGRRAGGPETAESGPPLAQARLTGLTDEWKQYRVVLRPAATVAKARLKLTMEGTGTLDVDVVSLFPKDTYMKRENGLRPDLVPLLKDLKPGFLRFPGGGIVEGMTLDNRYQWKETTGDVAARQPMINRWNKEFKQCYTPGYYQSFGLGFFEYFQLAEDLGAEPLPILNVGMACQFNSAELAPISAAKGPAARPAARPRWTPSFRTPSIWWNLPMAPPPPSGAPSAWPWATPRPST